MASYRMRFSKGDKVVFTDKVVKENNYTENPEMEVLGYEDGGMVCVANPEGFSDFEFFEDELRFPKINKTPDAGE